MNWQDAPGKTSILLVLVNSFLLKFAFPWWVLWLKRWKPKHNQLLLLSYESKQLHCFKLCICEWLQKINTLNIITLFWNKSQFIDLNWIYHHILVFDISQPKLHNVKILGNFSITWIFTSIIMTHVT